MSDPTWEPQGPRGPEGPPGDSALDSIDPLWLVALSQVAPLDLALHSVQQFYRDTPFIQESELR